MPTPKQVRKHYAALVRAHDRMQDTLSAAHNADVIVYDHMKYHEEGPCATHHKTWERIQATTEKQLAQAMRKEIHEDMRKGKL